MTVTEPQTAEQTNGGQASTGRTNMPTYGVGVPVSELPAEPERVKGKVYFDLLTQVKDNPDMLGLYVPIAEFKTPTGARDVAKSLIAGAKGEEGGRDVPKGEWEFKAVKLPDSANPTKRVSTLYVKYHGPG